MYTHMCAYTCMFAYTIGWLERDARTRATDEKVNGELDRIFTRLDDDNETTAVQAR